MFHGSVHIGTYLQQFEKMKGKAADAEECCLHQKEWFAPLEASDERFFISFHTRSSIPMVHSILQGCHALGLEPKTFLVRRGAGKGQLKRDRCQNAICLSEEEDELVHCHTAQELRKKRFKQCIATGI